MLQPKQQSEDEDEDEDEKEKFARAAETLLDSGTKGGPRGVCITPARSMNRSAEHRLGSLDAIACQLAGSETGAPIAGSMVPSACS